MAAGHLRRRQDFGGGPLDGLTAVGTDKGALLALIRHGNPYEKEVTLYLTDGMGERFGKAARAYSGVSTALATRLKVLPGRDSLGGVSVLTWVM